MKIAFYCLGLICLLLCAPLNFAEDTTPSVNVYGRLHFILVNVKDKNTSINTAGHRIGLKGEGKLRNGLGYFYKLETEYSNDNNFGKKDGIGGNNQSASAVSGTDLADVKVRHSNVGLKGRTGTVSVGRQGSPMTGTYMANVFEANSGAYLQTPYRIGHSIVFKSKSFSGAKAYLGAILEGGESDDSNEQNLNALILGGSYSLGDLHMDLGFFNADYDLRQPDDVLTLLDNEFTDIKTEFSNWSFGISYSMREIYVGLNLESSTEKENGLKENTDVIELAFTYTHETVVYGFGYGSADEGGVKKNRFLIGAYVNIGGNNDWYIETGQYNEDDGRGDNIVTGYRIKF